MKKLFKFIFVLVIITFLGGLIAGYVFLKNFDLNRYKGTIEDVVYQNTGRKLTINGNAHLGLSLFPTLVVDDISLSNAVWAKQPQMIKLQSLQIEVAVMPLLNKDIVINSVRLIEPQIYLEKSTAGLVNWDFAKAEKLTSARHHLRFAQLETVASDNQKQSSPLPDFIRNISLKQIQIQNGFVSYFDEAENKTQEATLKDISLSMENLDSPIKINADIIYQNEPISTVLSLGSFNTFFTDNKPFPFDISLQAHNTNTTLKGTVKNALKNAAYDFNLNLYNPASNFNLPETSLDADIKGKLKQITAEIKSLNIINNLITGTLKADITGKKPFVSANLKSPSFDLRDLSPSGPMAANFELIKSANASDMISDMTIPYAVLHALNADINLDIEKLIVSNEMTLDNILLVAKLNNGILNIKPLELNIGKGKLDLNAVIDADKQNLSLVLNGTDILLQDLHKEFLVTSSNDFGILTGGKTTLTANLTSQGKTSRQLLKNLSGQTVLLLSQSDIQTGSLHFLSNSFISQLLGFLNIDTKNQDKLSMQCAVVRTDIANGKASFPQGIAFQSNSLTVSGDGYVNLANEKINFTITPAFNTKSGITGALSSLLKIDGTLSQPKISLDEEQALKTIVGVATTGPAAYLGSQVLLSNSTPCYNALAGTQYQSLVPAPSASAEISQDVVQDTSAAVKESARAVKQELKNIEKNAKEIFKLLKGK